MWDQLTHELQSLSEKQAGGKDTPSEMFTCMGELLLREHNRKEDLPKMPHQANNSISGVQFPPLLVMQGLERNMKI